MNDIYVIIAGKYSDWSIIGYCDNEEEAAQRCIRHNDDENHYYDDEWYYKTVKNMPVERSSFVPESYIYDIFANFYNGEWYFPEAKSIHVELSSKEPDKTGVIFYNQKCAVYDKYARIIFRLDEMNSEKALKIAQDMLYKKLAELDNL